jgi:hypothetical protein
MQEYWITYSGGQNYGWGGNDWSDVSNAFDGDENTYTTGYVTSDFVATIPYYWDYTYTDALLADEHDNTTNSGTILGVYIFVYGYVTESGLDYYGFVNSMVSGTQSYFFPTFKLPTTSGYCVGVDITNTMGFYPFNNGEQWSWDGIDTLDMVVYFDGTYGVPEVNFNISKIQLLVVTED